MDKTDWLTIAFACALTLGAIGTALSHDSYSGWKDQKGKLCCNEKDCRPATTRFTNGKVEVQVDGTWCPVLRKHYRSDDKGPHTEWASPHVCVCKGFGCAYFGVSKDASPCERLVCYEPPGAGS